MKFRLLLLDANVVIYLHELSLWNTFIDKCRVTLTQTIIDESKYWEDEQGRQHPIDLDPDIGAGKINCVEVPLSVIHQFRNKHGPLYFERLDPGETESLALLINSHEDWLLSAADEIVFKILGREGRSEQGISLEEILTQIGMTPANLRPQYSKSFRLNVTRKGQIDGVTGFGHAD